MLRGFYALERTRTVFWVQCLIAAVNITLALLLVGRTDPAFTSPALVLSYAGAYAVGAVSSYSLLRHLLGGLRTPALVRFLVRMLLSAGPAALAAWGTAWVLHAGLGDEPGLQARVGAVPGRGRARRRRRLPGAGPAAAGPRGDRGGRDRDAAAAAAGTRVTLPLR